MRMAHQMQVSTLGPLWWQDAGTVRGLGRGGRCHPSTGNLESDGISLDMVKHGACVERK